ncbi:glycoside hydrolase family 79 protein [Glonium stellatum]|uniref:Glycoside hydrolase family 79 protein n=1 Tax=Glonium stellatum TaxID=574774 RepID=A0A8E2F9X9_9PEZI|nr:glycoside hydrolase family 79 protein [Glonium stellatum]
MAFASVFAFTCAVPLCFVQYSALANCALAYRNDSNIRELNAQQSINSSARSIDGSWLSISVEFCYMFNYFGNKSHPNKLSYQILQNLYKLSGQYSIIRAGGATASPPNGTKYTYDLNYQDNSSLGINNTVAEGQRVWNALRDSLYAFELGNEVEGWNKDGRSADWSPELYVPDYLKYTDLFDMSSIATLAYNLMNYTNVVNRVRNKLYILLEPNGISSVFGSALWYLDYNLYIASSTEVAKMYFHIGTPYRYSLWAPFPGAANDSALIRPTYYAALMLATALKGGQKQVFPIIQEDHLVWYSLYSRGSLDSIVVVNMNMYNSTMTTPCPSLRFKIPNIKERLSVRKLTASGAEAKTGYTWAGTTVNDQGGIVGQEQIEYIETGDVINVQDSEAILISIGKD